ncbi:tRNA (adenosine(37)-N6)-dimethylallyltransferase MiaA [uncultured Ilyobacter sp.]|uniref:tRNA (adenosine(37)-N6)-dimethylallyltransferase MiaA n=1 Tax=uncultured Ilyobacter sp. TaxID=544433 RepID=UPI0029C6B4FA|nr:tRNA (adenosine(37)-N6)-dimethylallyltransferase MiaA [uncultured Ilyobacter sp.]
MKGLVIAGPTAVGKTALSIKLAKAMGADIISADSAQIYKELDIGTAKVSEEEMQGIRHYMIDIVTPIKKYSVGEYQREVNNILSKQEKENKDVIITGGTGLYISSVTDGLSELPASDPVLRKTLMERSSEELHSELAKVDPEAAKDIHVNNKKRVERALEVYLLTGEKFSVISKKNIKGNNYKFLKVALERSRENLYERINMRVDMMVDAGLYQEVKKVYEKYGEGLEKINIIGYAEIIRHLKGESTLQEAVEFIKRNSRRYAKRQFTWFKNDASYIWYNLEEISEEEIASDVLQRLKNL